MGAQTSIATNQVFNGALAVEVDGLHELAGVTTRHCKVPFRTCGVGNHPLALLSQLASEGKLLLLHNRVMADLKGYTILKQGWVCSNK